MSSLPLSPAHPSAPPAVSVLEALLLQARTEADRRGEANRAFHSDVMDVAAALAELEPDPADTENVPGLVARSLRASRVTTWAARTADADPSDSIGVTLAALTEARQVELRTQAWRPYIEAAIAGLRAQHAQAGAADLAGPLDALVAALAKLDAAASSSPETLKVIARNLLAADPFIDGAGLQHEKYGTREWQAALAQAQSLADAGLLRI